MNDELVKQAKKGYKKKFGTESGAVAIGAGRVEVIGNFTDQLEGGLAIGAPIDKFVVVAVGWNSENKIRMFSENYEDDGVVEVELSGLAECPTEWSKYVVGVVHHLTKNEVKLDKGVDIYIASNLPNVGGLSSSAALEVSVILSVLKLIGEKADKRKLAKWCRDAEIDPDFVGGSCGYLDQGCSLSNGGVVLSFEDQEDGIPFVGKEVDLSVFKDKGYSLVVGVGTGRQLTQTGYAHKAGLAKRAYKGEKLGEEADRALKHLLDETKRVKEFEKACEGGDIKRVLRLLNKSGQSSLDLWGVADACPDGVKAVPELRFLVEVARKIESVGAVRNHGGGWNTTILLVVKKGMEEKVKQELNVAYKDKFGQKLEFVDIKVSQGSKAL